MKKQFPSLFLFLFLFLISSLSHSQTSQRFHSAGFTTGYGFEINNQAAYNLVFFAGDFSWQFGKEKRKSFLSFYLEPQFNLVFPGGGIEYEFGSNIGLRFYQELSPKTYFYQMLGSGPHYITADIARQAKGFIFSDNLGFGLMKQLGGTNPMYLNFQVFVRHISNAGLKEPNGGVNTLNFRIGISRVRRA